MVNTVSQPSKNRQYSGDMKFYTGVNGNVKCWPEAMSTGEKTSQFCADLNGTLLYMTTGFQESLMHMFRASQLTANKDEVLTWTKHRVNKQRYDEGKTYFSEFPLSDDVQSVDESTLCIYAIFYLTNDTVGWVPLDCNDNLKTMGCCHFDCANATLYEEAVTWYTAENYCAKEGGSLVNLTHSNGIYKSFEKTAWISSGLTKFWTGHYASGNIVENFKISKMDYFDEVVNNQTGCVYLIVKRQNKSFPKYQLATDSCNGATYGFICMKPTHEFYFDRIENMVLDSNVLKYDGQSYTITECQDQCIEMIKNGFACNGFGYNRANSSCRFTELRFPSVIQQYVWQFSSDWDTVDRTLVHATDNADKITLSYSYNSNDQATSHGDNADDHLAATVTGKTFAVFACIVVTVAGVAVIGSIIIKIMKITQHGDSSCAINDSNYGEDVSLSKFKPVVCGIINKNNFINRPPESFQLRRIAVSERHCSYVPHMYHLEYIENPSYSSFDF
ncbi:unnamed protein product [Mytilus edulis]|uniref:Apple domain-containing protein n=1 Tax=Mytilus edulis TaxID=6550 RepID=A0A8S3QNW6_MYTED|nr:unnamed protein product [Mytilus edulis]